MLRLTEHIAWSDKHGHLQEFAAFIGKLDEGEWHHLGD